MKSLLDYLPKEMVESCGMTQTPESVPNAGGRNEQVTEDDIDGDDDFDSEPQNRLLRYDRSEKAALDQLRKLPQPVSVNGGSYAYSCDVTKNPSEWKASDGSPIHPKSLRELGEWFEKHVQEEWDAFLDGYCDVEDLVQQNIIRRRAPRNQEDHETMNMQGESIDHIKKLAGL